MVSLVVCVYVCLTFAVFSNDLSYCLPWKLHLLILQLFSTLVDPLVVCPNLASLKNTSFVLNYVLCALCVGMRSEYRCLYKAFFEYKSFKFSIAGSCQLSASFPPSHRPVLPVSVTHKCCLFFLSSLLLFWDAALALSSS